MFLGLKIRYLAVQIILVSSVPVFLLYTEHLHLPWGKLSPAQNPGLLPSGPICAPPLPEGCLYPLTCQLHAWSLLWESSTAIHSLSLLLIHRTVLDGILCLRRSKRTSLDSAHLHIAASPPPTSAHFMGPGGHLKEHTRISTHSLQSPSDSGRVSSYGPTCPALMHPSNSRSGPLGLWPIQASHQQASFPLPLPDHMARPLATVRELLKNPNIGTNSTQFGPLS